MKPPSGGPTTGPRIAGTVRYDIAATSSDLRTIRNTMRRPTGTIMAPPNPCAMRAQTSCGSDCVTPHRIEPMVKMTIAVRNTVRAPKRSAIHPLIGMKTARLSRYEVIAMLRRIGSSCIECAMTGSAVEMIVESSISMNSADPTISGASWASDRFKRFGLNTGVKPHLTTTSLRVNGRARPKWSHRARQGTIRDEVESEFGAPELDDDVSDESCHHRDREIARGEDVAHGPEQTFGLARAGALKFTHQQIRVEKEDDESNLDHQSPPALLHHVGIITRTKNSNPLNRSF